MKLPLAAVFSFLLASLGHGQTFGTSVGSTADTNVLNNNQTAFAFDFDDQAHASTTVVNGVTFSGDLTQTGVTLSFSGFGSTDGNGIQPNVITGMGAADFDFIQQDNIYGGNGSITFEGLTAGTAYQLQLFAGTTSPSGTIALTDGSGSGTLAYGPDSTASANDFIVESFVAPMGGSETINFAGTDGYAILDAVDLRAVPEPSTYALMLGGIALLAFCVRRKLA